jgi:transposase InsO family protein
MILLDISSLPKSTYYYHNTNKKMKDDNKLIEVIREICDKNKRRYGYRKVVMILKNQYDLTVNHKKVLRIMREHNLLSRVKRKRYNSYKGEKSEIADNILNRDFKSAQINKKWVTDITEFKIRNKRVYLSPIMDLYSSDVISYKVSLSPSVDIVMKMLEDSIEKQENIEGLIIHTDQGFQYQNKRFSNYLKENGIIQSMSRKGNCYDNAVIENFFGILKSEFYYLEDFEDVADFKIKLAEYIEWYNNERISTKLKGMTPASARIHSLNK